MSILDLFGVIFIVCVFFGTITRIADGDAPYALRWIQAWWHRVTWDQHMNRPNGYDSIIGNLFATIAVIMFGCIVALGISALAKLWLGWMLQ